MAVHVNYTTTNGTQAVRRELVAWRPDLAQTTSWSTRFTTETPQPLPLPCASTGGCGPACGYAPDCAVWSRRAAGAPPHVQGPALQDFTGRMVMSHVLPLRSAGPGVAGVAGVDVPLEDLEDVLRTDSFANGTQIQIAVALNDTDLTLMGTREGRSTHNVSGALRSVPLTAASEGALALLGAWLQPRRGAVPGRVNVQVHGTLWEVSPRAFGGLGYFVAVGVERAHTHSASAQMTQIALTELERDVAELRGRLAAHEARTMREVLQTEQRSEERVRRIKGSAENEARAIVTETQQLVQTSGDNGKQVLEAADERQVLRPFACL